MHLRPATHHDAAAISSLALASKGLWGYDAAFLEACRAELTWTAGRLDDETVVVAEDDGEIVGFVAIATDGEQASLEGLFVDPSSVGGGVGQALWDEAIAAARAAGARTLVVEADPHAADWYRRRGAVPAGDVASGSIPGRRLPRFVLPLA